MPHSILMGRPMPVAGEPLFLQADTDLAIALAEEERDTCPSCGMPVAICSDPEYQFAFEPSERMCWPTYRLAQHRMDEKWTAKLDDTRQATMLSAHFRAGHEAPVDAGLDLAPDGGGADQHSEDR